MAQENDIVKFHGGVYPAFTVPQPPKGLTFTSVDGEEVVICSSSQFQQAQEEGRRKSTNAAETVSSCSSSSAYSVGESAAVLVVYGMDLTFEGLHFKVLSPSCFALIIRKKTMFFCRAPWEFTSLGVAISHL